MIHPPSTHENGLEDWLLALASFRNVLETKKENDKKFHNSMSGGDFFFSYS